MLKKLILTLTLVMTNTCWAVDSYNPSKNELTIQRVLAGGVVYTNVVITVGTVSQVYGGTPNGSMDIYNSATGELSIPSVLFDGKTYTNLVITIGKLISVGGIDPTGDSSSGGTPTDSTTNSSSVLVTTFISIN